MGQTIEDREELREAYEHYRHLEQERSRHLSFFVTLIGAVLGLLVFATKSDIGGESGASSFEFALSIVVFLQFFAVLTFISVRRVGLALKVHKKVIWALRTHNPEVRQAWREFEVSPGVSVQRSSELIVHLVQALLIFVNYLLLRPYMGAPPASWFSLAAISGLSVVALLTHVVVVWRTRMSGVALAIP